MQCNPFFDQTQESTFEEFSQGIRNIKLSKVPNFRLNSISGEKQITLKMAQREDRYTSIGSKNQNKTKRTSNKSQQKFNYGKQYEYNSLGPQHGQEDKAIKIQPHSRHFSQSQMMVVLDSSDGIEGIVSKTSNVRTAWQEGEVEFQSTIDPIDSKPKFNRTQTMGGMKSTVNSTNSIAQQDFFLKEKDFSPSRISQETVKPINYYLLQKEPYLSNLQQNQIPQSPVLRKIKQTDIQNKKWELTAEEVQKWQMDPTQIKKNAISLKKKFQDSIKKDRLILAIFNNRKDKAVIKKAVEELKHDNYMKKMVKNDPLFQKQLVNAPTDTIFTINKLFKDIDQEFMIQPIQVNQLTKEEKLLKFQKQMSIIILDEAKNLKRLKSTHLKARQIDLIEELGQAKIVIPEKKGKKRILYIEGSDDERLQAPIVGEGGKATQKIRKMIQTHFLTGYPWSIVTNKVTDFDFVIIQRLGKWKRGLENSLGENTLGHAYLSMRTNMFGIGYLERMQRIVGPDKYITKGNLDEIYANCQAKSNNIQKLFQNQTTKETFYNQVKNTNPKYLGEKEVAIQSYFEQIQKIHSIIPKPSFLKIEDNWIKLTEETISDIQAQLLKQYFSKTKDIQDLQVKHLMIDSCYMSDSGFATILQGIQSQLDEKGKTLLSTLIFTNGKLGQKSSNQIRNLLPGIREMSINNIQGNLNKNVARNIIESVIDNGHKLQKIRLSAINLNDEKTIHYLCQVFSNYQGELNCINLSNTSLTPKYLSMISEELKNAPQYIKKLDLSYNTLNFLTQPVEIEYSKKFVRDMKFFFETTELLHHLDISGMDFDSQSLIQLFEVMATSPNLMVIHVDDTHLIEARNANLLSEILSIFKLEENDSICRGKETLRYVTNDKQIRDMLVQVRQDFEQEEENKDVERDAVEIFKQSLKMSIIIELQKKEMELLNQLNIEKLHEQKQGFQWIKAVETRNRLMQATIAETELRYKVHAKINSPADLEEKVEIISKKNYKNQLIMVKQNNLIKTNKVELKSKAGQGIGRNHGNQVDSFVLSRKVNNPEMIWNQNPHLDKNPRDRFFQVDASNKWELSQKNECFICDGHKYTIIFFQQGLLSQYNQGLYEIKDPNVIANFENHYNYNYSKGQVYTPIICGSVVGGNDHQYPYTKMSFERKLRMMRLELFCTLMITNSTNFIQNHNDSEDIKTGIVEFSIKDKIGALNSTTILQKVEDWQDILYDKCLENQLTDVHVENATPQDFDNFYDPERNKNMFVYAAYLKPGIHKFTIYCPISKRAFCKTIMVDVNTKDYWPEYPTQFKKKRQKLILNVWRKSQKQDKEFFKQPCSLDIDQDLFDLSFIIKQHHAINVAKDLVRNRWLDFYLNFIEKQISEAGIESYPEMTYNTCMSYADSEINKGFKQVPLIIEQMEIQFIRCCRNQENNGIRGKLRRFEFIEFFIRIGKSSFPQMVPSLSLRIYIEHFLQPISKESTFLHERDLIKASKPLNKVLHENRGGLEYIFNKLKGKEEMLHKNKITAYMKKLLKSEGEKFDDMQLHKTFVYSLEIIVDEVNNSEKYWYIQFSEFLEYIVRIALKLFVDKKDGWEYKTCDFIKFIFEDEGILDPLKAKLRSNDVDISFVSINEEEECC